MSTDDATATATTTTEFGISPLMEITTTQLVGAGQAKSAFGQLSMEHRARDPRIINSDGVVPIYTTQTVGAGISARKNRAALGMSPKAMDAYDNFVRKHVGDYTGRYSRNMSSMAHPGMEYIRRSGMLDYTPELVDVMRAPGPVIPNIFGSGVKVRFDAAQGRYMDQPSSGE